MADISNQAKENWDAFEAGDDAAFRALYDLTYDELFRYGCRLMPRPGLVRDALQEMYLAMWQRRGKVPPLSNPWIFLLTTLRHKIIDESRREKDLRADPVPVPSAEEELLVKEVEMLRRRWLAGKLNELPERQREALHLRYRVELSYPEIAEVLGISLQAAYNYVNRAIKTLKQELTAGLEDFF